MKNLTSVNKTKYFYPFRIDVLIRFDALRTLKLDAARNIELMKPLKKSTYLNSTAVS